MVLPPDHADRVIAKQRARVEKVAMLGTLVLIASAGWWLSLSLDGSVQMLPRMGPVIAIFASALLLMDLIDYGPVERSRIAVGACIMWPLALALAVNSIGPKDAIIATSLLVIVAAFLLFYSRASLSNTLSARRLRGFSGLAGSAISIAVLVSLEIELYLTALVGIVSLIPVIPDLTSKDDEYESRQKFAVQLEDAEKRMLNLRSSNSGLEQAASLIQQAREQGWKDPARGMILIQEAEREAEIIMAMSLDIDAIRSDSLMAVERAEAIAPVVEGPRRSFKMGDREAGLGALREAETLYRLAKSKAATIEEHWGAAVEAISFAEEQIKDKSGSSSDSVMGILQAAREALDAEEPKEAIHIATAIPAHLESLVSTTADAKARIEEAEIALASAEGELALRNADRLAEAKEALAKGDAPLAKGLADSLVREARETMDAMQEVQRALRQKKQISAGFPSGEAGSVWQQRLADIEISVENGEWKQASESLSTLTVDLQGYHSEYEEAEELLNFVQDEWTTLRRRLNSTSIGPDDENRRATEQAVEAAKTTLEAGDIQACLTALGKADELLENLRRRV